MKKIMIFEYPDIKDGLFNWSTQCKDLNALMNKPISKEKNELFTIKLGHKQFKSSQDWLSNWKSKNNVVFRKICNENALIYQSVYRYTCNNSELEFVRIFKKIRVFTQKKHNSNSFLTPSNVGLLRLDHTSITGFTSSTCSSLCISPTQKPFMYSQKEKNWLLSKTDNHI